MSRIFFVVLMFAASRASGTSADLIHTTHLVHQYMQTEALTPQNCAADLTQLTQQIEKYNSNNLTRTEMVAATYVLVKNLWESRQMLRQKMVRFSQSGTLTPACVGAIRNAFAAFRFMEEYVGAHGLPAGEWLKAKPSTVFSGGFPAMMGAVDFSAMTFQSGDILVSYGMAYGSATISHVGEDAGAFSHLAMVYVDPQGAVFTIEAHPEFGVKVAPIDKYLHDGKGRSALFRHPDRQLAALAGKEIYDIAAPPDFAGRPIPYDFTMNLQNSSALFSTETASLAYGIAQKKLGRFVATPMYPTRITMKDPYIIDAFEIKGRLMFAPSDMDVDPQFEMIAEWRDLGQARLMHHQQAALKMQFKWLDDLNYSYRTDLGAGLATGLLYSGIRMPLFSGLLDKMIPPNLSRKALQALVNVYLTSDDILEKMFVRDRSIEKKRTGTLMTAKEIQRQLEELRKVDLAGYRAYQMERLYPTGGEGNNLPSDQFHWRLRARSEF